MAENSKDDLLTKYQKLATEYSKMKAQNIVLKKGINDEQSKFGKLKDEIREKDQKLRKFEQEFDCLKFHNQQLTKRVSILQEDIANKQQSAASGAFNSSSMKSMSSTNYKTGTAQLSANQQQNLAADYLTDDLLIIKQELINKINENERLHLEMESNQNDYKCKLNTLEDNLERLKSDKENQISELEMKLNYEKNNSIKLQQEKTRLETRLKQCLSDLQEINSQQKTPTQLVVNENNSNENSVYEERIRSLMDKLQIVDSKANAYYTEYCLLQDKLRYYDSEKISKNEEILLLNNQFNNLKEELNTTRLNYELQLSTMSEHLASMNDKLTQQNNEIDSLYLQLNSKTKGKKK